MRWLSDCPGLVCVLGAASRTKWLFPTASSDALESLNQQRCQAFRQSAAHRVDPFAVLAWLRKGEIEAQKVATAEYSPERFRAALRELSQCTALDADEALLRMGARCAAAGVALVSVPEIPGARVWGVTHWVNASKAIIQLSLRGKTADVMWFTFFHEAAHILLHPKKSIFVEMADHRDRWEEEADRFAADLLIPPATWQAVAQAKPRSRVEVQLLAERIGVAPGILVARMQKLNLLPWGHLNDLKVRVNAKQAG
ncbi:MAG: ImmA/IrrE family metallo-endopeptidase [Acidobacteria bacterium]|nr:ImmA/IrrE family metallo-endopeptidase [Acidobacteriota bacterium]